MLQCPKETLSGVKSSWDILYDAAMIKDGPGQVELVVHSGFKMFNSVMVKRKDRN